MTVDCMLIPIMKNVLTADLRDVMVMNKPAAHGDRYNPSWKYHPNFSWFGNHFEGAPLKPTQPTF